MQHGRKKIFVITSEGDFFDILSDYTSPKCAQSGQYISIKRHRSWRYCTLTVQTEVEGHTEQKEWYYCRCNMKTGSGEMKWQTVARWRVRSERTAEWNALQQEGGGGGVRFTLHYFRASSYCCIPMLGPETLQNMRYCIFKINKYLIIAYLMRQMHLNSVVWKRFVA